MLCIMQEKISNTDAIFLGSISYSEDTDLATFPAIKIEIVLFAMHVLMRLTKIPMPNMAEIFECILFKIFFNKKRMPPAYSIIPASPPVSKERRKISVIEVNPS